MHQLMHRVVPASVILLGILLLAVYPASARDDFQFTLQPNPRDQLQRYNETPQVRIAQQYGLGYLPLMVIRQYRLIEKHARQYGLGNVRVQWLTFPDGKKMNQALEAGFLDFASGGVVPMISAWDSTQDSVRIKGVAALSVMPVYLNTNKPGVKRLADFTDKDRIALPAPGASFQATVLQMAADRELGSGQANALDKLTIAMRHPDAERALLARNTAVTAHFASPPYQYRELQQPGIHKVLSSFDVLGGPTTFTALWSSDAFVVNNPHTTNVIVLALLEAMNMIKRDPTLAATTYIQQGSDSNLSESEISRMLTSPEHLYQVQPLNVIKIANFMHATGKIRNRPASESSLFFD